MALTVNTPVVPVAVIFVTPLPLSWGLLFTLVLDTRMPRSVITAYPSTVTLPPSVAEFAVTLVAVGEVTEGAVIGVSTRKNVLFSIGIAAHQIACRTLEHDMTSISGEGGKNGIAICLNPNAISAETRDQAAHGIFEEDVVVSIRITAHQIACCAPKRNIAAIGGEGGLIRSVVPLIPIGIDADPRDGTTHGISAEDVRGSVCIAAHQIARDALEDDVTAIGESEGSLEELFP